MNKKQITEKDVLTVIDELAGKSDGKTHTKAIVLRLGELFPEVHMKTVLVMLGNMKRAGLVKYRPAEMAWWLTFEGKEKLKNE